MLVALGDIKEDQKRIKRVLKENNFYRIRFTAAMEGYDFDKWQYEEFTEDARKYLENVLNLSIQAHGDWTNAPEEKTA